MKTKKEKKHRRDSNKNRIWIIVIISILLISLRATIYLVNHKNKKNTDFYEISKDKYYYKGYIFEKKQHYWQTETTKDVLKFRYAPWEVEKIPFNNHAFYTLSNKKEIILTTMPDYPSTVVLGMVDVAKLFNPKLELYKGIIAKSGLMKKGYGKEKITCDNSTNSRLVIEFLIGNDTYVSSYGNCIKVVGKDEWDVVKASDLLVYKWLGIMELK